MLILDHDCCEELNNLVGYTMSSMVEYTLRLTEMGLDTVLRNVPEYIQSLYNDNTKNIQRYLKIKSIDFNNNDDTPFRITFSSIKEGSALVRTLDIWYNMLFFDGNIRQILEPRVSLKDIVLFQCESWNTNGGVQWCEEYIPQMQSLKKVILKILDSDKVQRNKVFNYGVKELQVTAKMSTTNIVPWVLMFPNLEQLTVSDSNDFIIGCTEIDL